VKKGDGQRAAEVDVKATPTARIIGRRKAGALSDSTLHRPTRAYGAQRRTLTPAGTGGRPRVAVRRAAGPGRKAKRHERGKKPRVRRSNVRMWWNACASREVRPS